MNPFWDYFFAGAFSLVAYVFFYFFNAVPYKSSLASLTFFLLCIGNWPHFSSTTHRLYSKKENSKDYPLSYWLLPFVILALGVFSLYYPQSVGSWTVKVYSLWAPYHFSGQTLGVAVLYARRAGITLEKEERFWLSQFIYSTFLVLVIGGESLPWTNRLYDIHYQSLMIPRWLVFPTQTWCLFSGFIFLLCHQSASKKRGKHFPWIAYIPVISQFIWFIPGSNITAFYNFVPFFHSIQYLPFIWLLHMKDTVIDKTKNPKLETLRWYRINVAGGGFLFWAMPIFLVMLKFDYNITRPVMLVLVNLHHFIVDGVIWKLRNPKVSKPLTDKVESGGVVLIPVDAK